MPYLSSLYSFSIKVKIPLESSKDTRDYKDNVLDANTNGIGGTNTDSKNKGSNKGGGVLGDSGKEKEDDQ